MGTRLTDLVGCELPVQLAAVGGVGTQELAAAVVAAGGFGMVPMGVEPVAGACGANFLVPFVPTADVVSTMARGTRVVEFPGWRQTMPPGRWVEGDISDHALYAGTGVGGVRAIEPAARVVADLVRLL